jgi:twitching motility protein PilJ
MTAQQPNSSPTQTGKLRRFNLVGTVTASVAVSLVFFGYSTWNVWKLYQGYRTTVSTQFQLQSLSDTIVYLDEVLTMSARMAASTGNLKWETRYNQYVPKLDKVIKETTSLVPNILKAQSAQTDAANLKLVDLETQSFKLARQGRSSEALALLLGTQYEQQKKIYAEGNQKVIANINAEIAKQLQSYEQRLFWSGTTATTGLVIVLLGWLVILSMIRTYLQERMQAQNALLDSQTSLQQLNETLEVRSLQIQEQEQATKRENEILQSDVSHLLDIVSAAEDGDMTVQAYVSEGATGLVADTLNRLIEQLGNTLTQVLKAAQQVATGSAALEQLAKSVATNADQQAHEVVRVLGLTEQVQESAQGSAAQVQMANQSLLTVSQTVEAGQEAIDTLTKGIGVLQDGTERIVQKMKALGEFVGLADQFVQDQNQIASLTQVLALNATLVAARAAEQRDPRQFLVVAREFEAIASQVSNLAQQTNDGLVFLQQRTSQIHSVVAAVDAEVQGLGNLVNGFTVGVKQSNQAFSNVQTVTTEVVQAGQQVAQSSQSIVDAAQSTAQAMKKIAALAERTASLTSDTQQQSEQMEALSSRLLAEMHVFRLPGEIVKSTPQLTEATLNLSAVSEPRSPNETAEAVQLEELIAATGVSR